MILYHQIDAATLESILRQGVKTSQRGQKGQDPAIITTDQFLDQHRPPEIIDQGISRCDNVYAFLPLNDHQVRHITNGRAISVADLASDLHQALVKLIVDPARCFVADLDDFDQIKQMLADRPHDTQVGQRAVVYWSRLIPLVNYHDQEMNRPEVLITYDIPPHCITPVHPKSSKTTGYLRISARLGHVDTDGE
jgi:hypothetical protein